jgi:hypothetical protein
LDIPLYRLQNQRLSRTTFTTANEVVSWLGAVQSQDYAGAKWALAQRMTDTTDAALDQALADGSILRSHLLRPTWHFATPRDIRWMLQLTAPRVHAMNAIMYRQTELDKATFKKSYAVLEKSLRDGKQLTRTELASSLGKAGILAKGVRLAYIIMSAELEGLIVSGARRGKQFTYALLEERAPQARSLTREEALAELAQRYFTSRGPASLQDFAWWSGLTMTDARNGLELVKSKFSHETVNSQTYWFPDSSPQTKDKSPAAYLLPNYDEYLVGYTDRSTAFDASHTDKLDSRGGILFQHTIVLDSQVAGTWKRTLKKEEVAMEIVAFVKWTKLEKQAIAEAAERFGRFLELPVSVIHKEHSNEQRKTRSL